MDSWWTGAYCQTHCVVSATFRGTTDWSPIVTTSYARVKINHNLRMGSGGQSASWGLNLITVAPTDEADLESLLEDVHDKFDSVVGPNVWVKGYIENSSAYTDITGYYYPGGSPTATLQASTPNSYVGSGAGHLPFQTSVVCSLTTGRSGRHNRGRIYVPASGLALTANCQYDAAQTLALATQTAAYISALYDITFHSAPIVVVVPSTASSTGIPVTGVTVDSRADIQRRRADKQGALYQESIAVT